MCWCTASLLNREKSIFNCSGRLPQIVWRLLCSCSGLKLRPLLGFFVSNAGLERCPRALTVQAQCCVDRRPAQTGLLDDLHHADTCLVHTENLFAAFVQYFSLLLAGIFFLHKPLTTQIMISSFIARAGSIGAAGLNYQSRTVVTYSIYCLQFDVFGLKSHYLKCCLSCV